MENMNYKTCTGPCGRILPATKKFFHGDKTGKFGLRPVCKKCKVEYDKQRYQEKRNVLLMQRKGYYYENREKILKQKKRYRKTSRFKEIRKQTDKKYNKSEKGKETKRRYSQSSKGRVVQKKVYGKNKLSCIMSVMIRRTLKSDKAGRHWEMFVSYTLEQLKIHLESLFQPGMSWDNHDIHGWHIDHRAPISSFNITSYDCEDFKKCWALENLQPLWAEENLRKTNKFIS